MSRFKMIAYVDGEYVDDGIEVDGIGDECFRLARQFYENHTEPDSWACVWDERDKKMWKITRDGKAFIDESMSGEDEG